MWGGGGGHLGDDRLVLLSGQTGADLHARVCRLLVDLGTIGPQPVLQRSDECGMSYCCYGVTGVLILPVSHNLSNVTSPVPCPYLG